MTMMQPPGQLARDDPDMVVLTPYAHMRLTRIANSIEQLGLLIEVAPAGIVKPEHVGQLLTLLGEDLNDAIAQADTPPIV